MSDALPLRQRLEDRIRQSLRPAPFPERRDFELAFAVGDGAEKIAFIDHFWQDERHLWVTAAQLGQGGLDKAVAAAGLRQLIRALAAETDDPRLVIEDLQGDGGSGIDAVAVARIDATSGRLRHAVLGNGCCSAVQTLEPGGIFWLTIGGQTPDPTVHLPAEGLQSLVDRNFGDPRRALAAIHFKGAAKRRNVSTLSVRNDRAAVPDALRAAGEFMARHDAAEADASALEVALDEILTNQINYGFRDGSAHEMLVDLRIDGDRLAVEIRDDGVPFDPLGIAAPDLDAGIEERQIGGLGMHFVRTLFDQVSYRRQRGWNVLVLGRALAPRVRPE